MRVRYPCQRVFLNAITFPILTKMLTIHDFRMDDTVYLQIYNQRRNLVLQFERSLDRIGTVVPFRY